MPGHRLPGILPPPSERADEHGPVRRSLGEGGFLMATAAVIILVTVAILSSVTFVFNRDFDYKVNYAAGERLAEVAVMAHSYAQVTHYSTNPVTSLDALGNLYTGAQMNPPDNLAFDSIGRIALELTIRGRDLAPSNGLAPAASAYLHLKIRTPVGITRRPTDEVAFLAGAASRGMDRVGIVGQNTGPDCDGAAARVRWGPEVTACLNAAQINLIGFTDVQDGDVIVPAWETALARIGDDVVLRFPQPERPDLNMMNVDMQFAPNPARPGRGYSIGEFDAGVGAIDMASGAGEMNTDFVDQNNNMNTIGDFRGEMVVRQGSPLNMNGPAITNSDFTILDESGAPVVLNVAGATTITGDVSVSERLDYTSSLVVTADTETQIDTMGVLNLPAGNGQNVSVSPPVPTAANPAPGPDVTVAAESMESEDGTYISTIQALNAGDRFGVGGVFDTTNAIIEPDNAQPLDIYAAELVTGGTANINNTGDWNVGSIDQRGSGALQMDHIRADQDCIGSACPDNITEPPDDPPL